MRSRYSQPFDSISNSQRNGSISALHSKQRDAPRNTKQQTSEQHNDQAEGKEPTLSLDVGLVCFCRDLLSLIDLIKGS